MELILFYSIIFLGIFSGIITGLIPGIHINLIATFILIKSTILLTYLNINLLIIYIISMSITHTFLDFIPSIIFGIPSSDTTLSILPAHQMVLEGDAYKAILLSSTGSLFGITYLILASPLIFIFLDLIYNIIKPIIPYLLILTTLVLILYEKDNNKKFWSIIIILFSGSFGLLILNSKITNNHLLILFSGLFALPILILSLKEKNSLYPIQNYDTKIKIDKNFIKSIFVGGISSTICSITPGIGNAQAATISSIFFKNINSQNFLVTVSAINTINFALSIITFYLINKARNGSIIVISQLQNKINLDEIILYLLITILVSIFAFSITIYLGKYIIKNVSKFNIKKLNLSILIFLISIIFILTNVYGIIILMASTFLGLLCINLNVKKIHLMNVLIIPIIINLI